MKDKCMSCGGRVDAHGMALGGKVDDERPMEEESEPYEGQDPENDDGETTQMESEDENNEKARRAFIRAVRSR